LRSDATAERKVLSFEIGFRFPTSKLSSQRSKLRVSRSDLKAFLSKLNALRCSLNART